MTHLGMPPKSPSIGAPAQATDASLETHPPKNAALNHEVVVVGGGIVGLTIAVQLQRSGHQVLVIDPSPAQGATFAAAGMLAPVSEFHFQEDALNALMLESARLWPDFAASLASSSSSGNGSAEIGYNTQPTLVLGADVGDRGTLNQLKDAQLALGLDIDQLTLREARAREPLLSSQLACAFLSRSDNHIDPRAVAQALQRELFESAESRGHPEPLLASNVEALLHTEPGNPESPIAGVFTDDAQRIFARETILANALGTAKIAGLPEHVNLPLRPVFGDILRLRVPEHLRPLLSGTIRGSVRGVPIYLVPRADNTIVIGATSREDGNPGVSAGGVYQLLRDAAVLLPAVAELELIEVTARARPGTPDNSPLIGRIETSDGNTIPGLILATGLFRHGVLLSPITAQICLELVNGKATRSPAAIDPNRFSNSIQATNAKELP